MSFDCYIDLNVGKIFLQSFSRQFRSAAKAIESVLSTEYPKLNRLSYDVGPKMILNRARCTLERLPPPTSIFHISWTWRETKLCLFLGDFGSTTPLANPKHEWPGGARTCSTMTWNDTGLSIRETSFDRYQEEYILDPRYS